MIMEKDLGYRRVQSTGRGSYIISLPKEWVNDLGIAKGSEVAFKLRDDSSLILTPSKMVEEKVSEKSLNPRITRSSWTRRTIRGRSAAR